MFDTFHGFGRINGIHDVADIFVAQLVNMARKIDLSGGHDMVFPVGEYWNNNGGKECIGLWY